MYDGFVASNYCVIFYKMGFHGGSVSKESTCQCRKHRFNSWVRKIPWKRRWQPTPVFLSGKPHGQRSLAGYSPWGRNESDTTERLTQNQGVHRVWNMDRKGWPRICPVVQWLRLHLPIRGSIPGQGAKIPHASWRKNQNIKQKQFCNIVNKHLKKKKVHQKNPTEEWQ